MEITWLTVRVSSKLFTELNPSSSSILCGKIGLDSLLQLSTESCLYLHISNVYSDSCLYSYAIDLF